jgi:hypothetical protein
MESEERAKRFAGEHFHHFVNRLLIKEDPSFPFLDNANPRIVGDLGGLGEWLDLDQRIEVWEEDWQPLDIQEEFESKFLEPENISRIPPEEFKDFLARARALVGERWLGVVEYNYMVRRLQVVSTDKGNFSQWKALEGEAIKPNEVGIIIGRTDRGEALARIKVSTK